MRCISEDPIGLAGGMNWYAYVGNDPVNYADPWGLGPCPAGYIWYPNAQACGYVPNVGEVTSAGYGPEIPEFEPPIAILGPGPIHFPFSPGGTQATGRTPNPTCKGAVLHVVATAALDLLYGAALTVGTIQVAGGPVVATWGVATANPPIAVVGVVFTRVGVPAGIRTFRGAVASRLALAPSYAVAKAAEGYGSGWKPQYMRPFRATGDAISTATEICR